MRRLGMVVALAMAILPVPALAATNGERALFHRINAVRAAHHLRMLRPRAALHAIAVAHTRYLIRIGQLRHESADGTSAGSRIRSVLRVAETGETIAAGNSVRQLIHLWMNSPPHRAILLDPHMRFMGIGIRIGSYDGYPVRYATADLGG